MFSVTFNLFQQQNLQIMNRVGIKQMSARFGAFVSKMSYYNYYLLTDLLGQ